MKMSESNSSEEGSPLNWTMARSSSSDPLNDSITRSAYAKVIFHDIRDVYPENVDLECKYTLTSDIVALLNDRVGLYRLGESLPQNYITTEWVPQSSSPSHTIRFKASSLPKEDEEFYQLYYISDGEIRGASTPFQFRSGAQPTFDDSSEDGDLVIVKYPSTPDDTENRIQALKERCQMLEERHHDSEKKRELLMQLHEARNNELQEKQAEITDLNNQLTEIRKSQKRLCERVCGMEQSAEKAQEEKKSALEEKRKCETVIEVLQEKTDRLQEEKVMIMQTREDCEKLISELQNKLDNLEKDGTHKVNLKMMEQLQTQLDSVSKGYENRLKDMEETMKQTVQQHHQVKVMIESEKRATQLELEEKRKKVVDLDHQIMDLSFRNHENMLNIDALHATILSETMEKENLCKRLKEVLKDNENLRRERAELIKENESVNQKESQPPASSSSSISTMPEFVDLSDRVGALTDRVSSLENRKKDLETAMDDSTERRQMAQDRLAELSKDIAQLHTTNQNLREQKSLLEKECQELKNFVRELQDRLKSSAEQFQSQYMIILELNKKIKKLEMDKKGRAIKDSEESSVSVSSDHRPTPSLHQKAKDHAAAAAPADAAASSFLPPSNTYPSTCQYMYYKMLLSREEEKQERVAGVNTEIVDSMINKELQQFSSRSSDSHPSSVSSSDEARPTANNNNNNRNLAESAGNVTEERSHATLSMRCSSLDDTWNLVTSVQPRVVESSPASEDLEATPPPSYNMATSPEVSSVESQPKTESSAPPPNYPNLAATNTTTTITYQPPREMAAASVQEGATANCESDILQCPFCDYRIKFEPDLSKEVAEEVLTEHVENLHLPKKCPMCTLEFQPGEGYALERHVHIAHFSHEDGQPLRLSDWDLGID